MAIKKVSLSPENQELFDFKVGDRVVRKRGDGDPGIIVGGWCEFEQHSEGISKILLQMYTVKRPTGTTFDTICDELRRS